MIIFFGGGVSYIIYRVLWLGLTMYGWIKHCPETARDNPSRVITFYYQSDIVATNNFVKRIY